MLNNFQREGLDQTLALKSTNYSLFLGIAACTPGSVLYIWLDSFL